MLDKIGNFLMLVFFLPVVFVIDPIMFGWFSVFEEPNNLAAGVGVLGACLIPIHFYLIFKANQSLQAERRYEKFFMGSATTILICAVAFWAVADTAAPYRFW